MAQFVSSAEKVSPTWYPPPAKLGGLVLATPLEDLWLLSILANAVFLPVPGWLTAATLALFFYHLGMAALDVDFDNHPWAWPVAVFPRVPMWTLHIPSYLIVLSAIAPTAAATEAGAAAMASLPAALTPYLSVLGWALFFLYRLALFALAAGTVYINSHLVMSRLPAPFGPHKVATHISFMKMEVEGDQRTCRVRTCFPADIADESGPAHPYSYWPSTATIRMLLGMNPNSTKYFPAERYLFHVHTHGVLYAAGENTKVAAAALRESSLSGNGRLPILLFSHGLVGCPESDTIINTQLASWGFISMEIEHHDGSAPYTLSPWDEGKPVTLSMPTDELRDTNPPMYHQKAGEHLHQRISELGMLLEVMHGWEQESLGKSDGIPGLEGKDLSLLRQLLVDHGDFGMVFASGHSAGAGAVYALAALEASGRTVPPESLGCAVAGWEKEVFPDLTGTVNDRNPAVVLEAAKAAVAAPWPTPRPRVKLQGTVPLDPWINSIPFDWAHSGMCGARVMVVMSSLYGGAEDLSRDKDHYHRRDALLMRQSLNVHSRVTAWQESVGLNHRTPRVAHTLKTRGLRNGVDQHARPLVPLPYTKEEVDALEPEAPDGTVLGVHPMSCALSNPKYEHLNFNDCAIVMTSVGRVLDYLGKANGIEPCLGSVPDTQGVLHLADVVRVALTQFAKDVNFEAGNTKGVQFTPQELEARTARGPGAAPLAPAASPTWTAIAALQQQANIDERVHFSLWDKDVLRQWWDNMAAYDASIGGDLYDQYLADVAAGKDVSKGGSMPT